MGLILGKVDGPMMIVMDVFALPVEGTDDGRVCTASGRNGDAHECS